jgi:nucleotide-binding universal stress UspA family protein
MTDLHGAVVAAVDGSVASDAALRFACQEAAQRRVPLTLVHAWQPYPVYANGLWSPMPLPVPVEDLEESGRQVLTRGAALVEQVAPGLEHSEELVRGRTVDALLTAARTAAVLVVGGRERGHQLPGWLGSVPLDLARHAPCPLLVVPSEPVLAGDVVVGVDGSEVSADAIAFAFEQAARRGSALRAVTSFSPGYGGIIPEPRRFEELHEEARRQLSEALAGWSEKFPEVEVSDLVSLEHPFRALLTAAEGAGLLVVGSHGRGVARRYVLGSVSAAVLRAASCPVAIVRPQEHPA